MAIVLALTLADSSGPTTVLTPAGDRIAGILLGVLVMGVVDAALWPVFGETALRRALAGVLAQMADMHRAAARGDAATRRQLALGIHRALANVVAMQDDLAFDPGRGDRATAHAALLRVIGGVERLFLDLLALGRHRPATPPPARTPSSRGSTPRRPTPSHASGIGRASAADRRPSPSRRFPKRSTHPSSWRPFGHLYGAAVDAIAAVSADLDALEDRIGSVTVPAARPRRTPAPLPS